MTIVKDEIWKICTEFSDYQISNLGRISGKTWCDNENNI